MIRKNYYRVFSICRGRVSGKPNSKRIFIKLATSLCLLLLLTGKTSFAQYYLDQYYYPGQTVSFNRAQSDVYNGSHIFAIGDYSFGGTVDYVLM
jgi:hypothetical protein